MPMRRSTNSLVDYARNDSESSFRDQQNWAGGVRTSGGSKLKVLDRRTLLASTKEPKGSSSDKSFRRTFSGSTLNIGSSFRRSANNLTKRLGKEDLKTKREFGEILNPCSLRNAEFTLSTTQKKNSKSKGMMDSFNGSFRSLVAGKDLDADDDDDDEIEDVLDWDQDSEEYDLPLHSKSAKDRIIALACRELELAFD